MTQFEAAMMPKAILVLALITVTTTVWAIDYTDRKRGWFWYEVEIEEVEAPIEEEPLPAPMMAIVPPARAIAQPPDTVDDKPQPPQFSTAWLRENLPIALDAAMDDPTPEKIAVYAYMQRAAFDRSEQFARNFQRVVLADPLLDENNNFPIATFGARAARSGRDEDRDKRLGWLAENVGFFYFHDATCQYCIEQLPVLSSVARSRGFKFMAISMDGSALTDAPFDTRPNDGHAERFNVSRVPAIVMVYPPNNAAVISQGILSVRGLESRAIAVAEDVGLLSEVVDRELGITKQQFLTDTDTDSMDIDFVANPSEWVRRIRSEAGYE